jgi:hypothetical protein
MMRPRRQLIPPLDFRFLDLMLILIAALSSFLAYAAASGRGEVTPLAIRNRILSPGFVGREYLGEMVASGGREPYAWTAHDLPPHVALDPRTGQLSGTPSEDGAYDVSIAVASSDGQRAEKRFGVQVDRMGAVHPLRIITDELPPATAGARYSVAIAAEGGVLPYRWTFDGVPSDIEVRDGVLTGTPAQQAVHSIVAELTDAAGAHARHPYTLRVMPARSGTRLETPPPLTLDPRVPKAILGDVYRVKLAAEGGVPPYQWQLLHDIPGLALEPGGFLTTNAMPASPPRLYIRLFDASGAEVDGEIMIEVVRPPGLLFKAAVVLGVMAAWVLLSFQLWQWALVRPRPLYARSADLSTALSIGFALIGIAVYIGTANAALLFVLGVSGVSWMLYRDYT